MKLLINDIEIDAIGDQDIALTKSVNDMMQLGSREGAFSSDIEAGLSTNNRMATSNAQSSNSNTNFPYQNNKAAIEIKGERVLEGFAELTETSESFNFRCFSELADVVDLIGEGDLNELNLDFSDGTAINHLWTYANVVANRNNVWADGFIYPNINYGKWTDSQTKAYWNDLYPSVFCKYLFLRIFHSIGYAVTGEFLTNELFESEILPMVEIPETPQYYLDAQKTDCLITYGQSYFAGVSPFYFDYYQINNNNQLYNTSNSTVFKPSIYGKITSVLNITLDTIAAIVLKEKTPSLGLYNDYPFSGAVGANTFTQSIQKKAADTYFYWEIQTSLTTTLSNGSWTNDYDSQKLIENNTVFVSECLPKISKKDFLLTIINQFNLMLKVDTNLRTIDFSYFNSVEANKTNAIDLSDKIDLTELPTITYKLDGYGQNNELNYETDENDEELRKVKNYGQGILNCNNLSLEKTKEIFLSKFAPITRKMALKSPDNLEMAFIHLWALSETTFRTQNVKPRIGYVYNNDEILDLYKTEGEGGGGGGVGYDSSPSKGVYFEKLQFSSGLIPNYYRILFDMLLNTYFFKANFKIRLKDYKEIDFTKPIFLSVVIKGFGTIEGYFYCNKINQFKINRYESTEIELIKL
jgi:hypothetical protein